MKTNHRGDYASEDSNKRQRKTKENQPKQPTVFLNAVFKGQVGPKPRKCQHDQATTDHDPKRKERDQNRWADLLWKVGQANLFGVQAHAPDQTAQDGDLDLVIVALCRLIGD